MKLRGEWHDAYSVVMQRLGKLLGLDVELARTDEVYTGRVTTDWLGDGRMLRRARAFVNVSEMLLADYRATFDARA